MTTARYAVYTMELWAELCSGFALPHKSERYLSTTSWKVAQRQRIDRMCGSCAMGCARYTQIFRWLPWWDELRICANGMYVVVFFDSRLVNPVCYLDSHSMKYSQFRVLQMLFIVRAPKARGMHKPVGADDCSERLYHVFERRILLFHNADLT